MSCWDLSYYFEWSVLILDYSMYYCILCSSCLSDNNTLSAKLLWSRPEFLAVLGAMSKLFYFLINCNCFYTSLSYSSSYWNSLLICIIVVWFFEGDCYLSCIIFLSGSFWYIDFPSRFCYFSTDLLSFFMFILEVKIGV